MYDCPYDNPLCIYACSTRAVLHKWMRSMHIAITIQSNNFFKATQIVMNQSYETSALINMRQNVNILVFC